MLFNHELDRERKIKKRWRIIRGAMATLSELKGSEIIIRLLHPLIEQKEERGILVTKLVEVEDSGIWIEGRDLANFLHEKYSKSIIPKMPLFFVPFAQIGWITGSADYPSLSEKHFGV